MGVPVRDPFRTTGGTPVSHRDLFGGQLREKSSVEGLSKILPGSFGPFIPSLCPREISAFFAFDRLVFSNLVLDTLPQLFSNSLRKLFEWIG